MLKVLLRMLPVILITIFWGFPGVEQYISRDRLFVLGFIVLAALLWGDLMIIVAEITRQVKKFVYYTWIRCKVILGEKIAPNNGGYHYQTNNTSSVIKFMSPEIFTFNQYDEFEFHMKFNNYHGAIMENQNFDLIGPLNWYWRVGFHFSKTADIKAIQSYDFPLFHFSSDRPGQLGMYYYSEDLISNKIVPTISGLEFDGGEFTIKLKYDVERIIISLLQQGEKVFEFPIMVDYRYFKLSMWTDNQFNLTGTDVTTSTRPIDIEIKYVNK